jgi:hypothetical protein
MFRKYVLQQLGLPELILAQSSIPSQDSFRAIAVPLFQRIVALLFVEFEWYVKFPKSMTCAPFVRFVLLVACVKLMSAVDEESLVRL